MIKTTTYLIIPIFVLFLCTVSACSKKYEILMPGNNNSIEFKEETVYANREVIAVYDAEINPEAGLFTIRPAERQTLAHIPLTLYYPNVLSITAYGFTPNFWADIRLTHPYPGSGIDGFDARVIAILPAKPGNAFYYPLHNVGSNNTVILQPDGYTKLFDSLGGSISGNANPFMAYFKNQPYRVWSSTGVKTETRRWNMNLAGFGGSMTYKLVVDVSTNYPNPPKPIIDNAPEPVEIKAYIGESLTRDNNGNTLIEVTLLDWQGVDGIGSVTAECPSLFDGILTLWYSRTNGNYHVFENKLSNSKRAPDGTYKVLVCATDSQTGIESYNEFTATVKGVYPDVYFNESMPFFSEFHASRTFVDGNYLYVIEDHDQPILYIWDITNPSNPSVYNWLSVPNLINDFTVKDGYAYLATQYAGLKIYDIDPPETPYLVKTVNLNALSSIWVENGYAYITTDDPASLYIVDVDPPQSAGLVKAVGLYYPCSVKVYDGYAFVGDSTAGLTIVDIDPPQSAYVVNSIPTDCGAYKVEIMNGYAFVSGDLCPQFYVFDIDPPASTALVKTLNMPVWIVDFKVNDDYAFLTDVNNNINVIDINPPESTQVVYSVNSSEMPSYISLASNIAYVTTFLGNIYVVDITEPVSSYIAKKIASPNNAKDLYVDSNCYVYVADGEYGFTVIHYEEPFTMYNIDTTGYAVDVSVYQNYAYVADSEAGLEIFDISTPDSAVLVKTFDTPGSASGVYAFGGYACVADSKGGIHIIDVIPPESTFIVKTLPTQFSACKVTIAGEYAYVTDRGGYLNIIDVYPPQTAYIVNSVPTPGEVYDVKATSKYAYVGAFSDVLLYIYDVSNPTYVSLVQSAYTGWPTMGFSISNGFAYIGSNDGNGHIVDLEPYFDAGLILNVNMDYSMIHDIFIKDYKYIYAACGGAGVKAYSLR